VRSLAGRQELTFNPLLDVMPSVADMSSDTESRRAFPSVPPLVEGAHRDPEVAGEFLNGQKTIGCLHVGSLIVDAFIPVAETLSPTLQLSPETPGPAVRCWHRNDRRMTGSRALCGQGCRLVGGFMPIAVPLSNRSQSRFQVSFPVRADSGLFELERRRMDRSGHMSDVPKRCLTPPE
jgi:hypothetical protein